MQTIQTQFLDPTNRMETVPVNLGSLIKFNIYDFSGHYDLADALPPEIAALENCGLMIFVIDGSAELNTETIQYLRAALQKVKNVSSNCMFHILIHKIDPESQLFEDDKRNGKIFKYKFRIGWISLEFSE